MGAPGAKQGSLILVQIQAGSPNPPRNRHLIEIEWHSIGGWSVFLFPPWRIWSRDGPRGKTARKGSKGRAAARPFFVCFLRFRDRTRCLDEQTFRQSYSSAPVHL